MPHSPGRTFRSMSQLLGMSFDAPCSPSITLGGWSGRGKGSQPTGWGFAWYPSADSAAAIVKDPIATGETPMTALLRDWEHFRSTTFLCHLRGAAKRVAQEDTHPFSRSLAGRDWVLAHNGDLDPQRLREFALHPLLEPVGHTDSERALCWLLSQAAERGARQIADLGWAEVHALLRQLDAIGTLNVVLTDGIDLVAYRDAEGFNELWHHRRTPPHATQSLINRYLELDLGHALDENRTAMLVSTTPLSETGWTPLAPGAMLAARRGLIVWRSDGEEAPVEPSPLERSGTNWTEVGALAPPAERPPTTRAGSEAQPTPQQRGEAPRRPTAAATRIMSIEHTTEYVYGEPVERSTHLLRLRPVQDSSQDLLDYDLEVEPVGLQRSFEDVFGNQSTRLKLQRPYHRLVMRSRSRVRLRPPNWLLSPTRRATIPLVWMPWQRQMMVPYLLPPELPEAQLRELTEFAMSFVERQDYDLDATLDDMNRTIHRDFAYISGSTSVETTPFDVYVSRRGVCQDFANLFICLARLLNIPARYRVGYIYTGGDYENKQQSDASHAWVETYLPFVGWRGYDPTNGRLAGLDHVRVASGRNYRDATPTSGTIFKGGLGETLTVGVRVTLESEE